MRAEDRKSEGYGCLRNDSIRRGNVKKLYREESEKETKIVI